MKKPRGADRLIRRFDNLARAPLSPWLTGCLCLVLHLGIAGMLGVPLPQFHDEFSYLLAADTFAHGRVTNPTHPLWQHFESFQIIHEPSYQSKYQPGLGIVLAIGQVLTGYPIFGMWFLAGFTCAAIHWMLRGWLPPRWALIGALLAVVHPLLLRWGQSYWGGLLPALGGALILGAFPRIWYAREARDRQREERKDGPWHRILSGPSLAFCTFATGVVILAASRPYEGLVLTLLLAIPLLWRLRRRPIGLLLRQAMPAMGILLLAGAWMLYYNARVTGNALRMPYLEHERHYAAAPPFLWQSAPPAKEYRHEVIRKYHQEYELGNWRKQRKLSGFFAEVGHKLMILANGYVAPLRLASQLLPIPWRLWGVLEINVAWMALTIVLAAAGWVAWRRRWVRRAAIIAGLFLAGCLAANWMFTHYPAPGVGLFFYFLAVGLRALWHMTGRWQSPARPLVVIVLVLQLPGLGLWCVEHYGALNSSWGQDRRNAENYVLSQPGRHLILVRYGPDHNHHLEWVYNAADIDSAPIVWAREMSPEENRRLMEYYADRTVWLLIDDGHAPTLNPLPSAGRLLNAAPPAR